MKNQPSSSIKNTCLFKIYDIEHNYHRHKQKINQIKNSNAKQKVKKQYKSQVNAATELKKNWYVTQANRQMQKDKQIYDQNQLLYKQIINARNRESQRHKIMSQTNILNRPRMRTSYSVNQQNSFKIIQKQNEKLMEKILTVKSPLSKKQMKESYKKVKQTKKILQTYSSLNKSRIKSTLTKFKIKPQIYFPTIGTQLNQSQVKRSRQSRKSCSFSKMSPVENEFLSVNDDSSNTKDKNQWKNQFLLARKKNSRVNQKHNKTKIESPYKKPYLNRTNF